jgi:mRNA-degrading endonuclease RelE of RelBE toxin-antitoxin system
MWKIERTNAFNRQYKHLSSELKKKTDDGIRDLYSSEEPHLKGRHKTAKFNCLRGYDLGRRYRILYEVNFETRIIYLRSVGIHDEVYR